MNVIQSVTNKKVFVPGGLTAFVGLIFIIPVTIFVGSVLLWSPANAWGLFPFVGLLTIQPWKNQDVEFYAGTKYFYRAYKVELYRGKRTRTLDFVNTNELHKNVKSRNVLIKIEEYLKENAEDLYHIDILANDVYVRSYGDALKILMLFNEELENVYRS